MTIITIAFKPFFAFCDGEKEVVLFGATNIEKVSSSFARSQFFGKESAVLTVVTILHVFAF